jgi:hypothetical protein
VVWVEHAGLTLAAVQHEPMPLQPGDIIRFGIERSRVSLFDAASGLRL